MLMENTMLRWQNESEWMSRIRTATINTKQHNCIHIHFFLLITQCICNSVKKIHGGISKALYLWDQNFNANWVLGNSITAELVLNAPYNVDIVNMSNIYLCQSCLWPTDVSKSIFHFFLLALFCSHQFLMEISSFPALKWLHQCKAIRAVATRANRSYSSPFQKHPRSGSPLGWAENTRLFYFCQTPWAPYRAARAIWKSGGQNAPLLNCSWWCRVERGRNRGRTGGVSLAIKPK